MASQLKTELLLKDNNFSAKLDSVCKKAKASLNEISQSTKGLSGMLGNLSGKIGGMTSSINGLLGSASKLANPWVLAGTAIIGAGTAFFNYNKNLEETKNLTEQFTGLSGKELDSLRNNIDAVASGTGKDFKEVLQGVDGLMSQFGISGETALQIIQDGFVSGADESGQFLDNLSKYSGAFNDMGVSADELAALLAQTRSGIFAEDGMDAIQMAGKNIRTMSNSAKQSLAEIGISGDEMTRKLNSGQMTTMDAIKQISGALKKLPPQSQAVGDVLQDVFGKKGSQAGYEMITALEDLSTNLDEVKEQTGENGKVQEELIETTKQWNAALQSLFGVSDSGFSHLTDQLKISVMQALTKVINRFIDLYNKSVIVRGGIAAIAAVFKSVWAVVKGILKGFADALEGLGTMLEGLVTADWDKMKSGAKKTLNGIKGDVKGVAKEIAGAWGDAWDQTKHGHIDRTEVLKADKDEYGKTTGKGGSGGKASGKGSGKGGKSGSNKGNKGNKNTKVEPVAGSLGDLEKQLKDLQDKYKNGLIKITPDDYQKQVKELEDKIEQKKIELKLAYDKDSVEGLEEQLKKLQDNQKSTNTELHLDTKEFYKQEAELIKKIQDKKVSLLAELDPDSIDVIKQKLKDLQENQTSQNVYLHLETKEFNKQEAELIKQLQDKELAIKAELDDSSLSVLEQKLKNLEENQISENVYLHIDGEEYKKQHKELERQIESEKIKLGVSLNLVEADKEFNDLMKDYRKKSSFDIAVGQEKINPADYESQLGLIQSQMEENDQLLEQLKELQKAYKELGEAGASGYETISSKIAQVESEQTKLGDAASKTNELSKSQKKLTKNFSESADAVGNFGSMLGTLGDISEDPALNVMGIIASAIAQVLQGAGEAIAKASDLGPWGWVAAGLSIMGVATSLVSQIHSLSGYAQGGIVKSGKTVGDKNIIAVNGREMVLNDGQQNRLWRIINGEQPTLQSAYSNNGYVEFKLRGTDFVGMWRNYDKKHSKI